MLKDLRLLMPCFNTDYENETEQYVFPTSPPNEKYLIRAVVSLSKENVVVPVVEFKALQPCVIVRATPLMFITNRFMSEPVLKLLNVTAIFALTLHLTHVSVAKSNVIAV